MDDTDNFFQTQQKIEDKTNLIALTSQISVNLGVTIIILLLFNWLRPKFTEIYAPKTIQTKDEQVFLLIFELAISLILFLSVFFSVCQNLIN